MMKKTLPRLALFLIVMGAAGFGVYGLASAKDSPAGTYWAVRCDSPKAKSAPKSCEAFQRLSVKKKGSKDVARLAEFAVGFPPEKKGGARGVIVMPLGLLLESSMTLAIGGNAPLGFHFRYCQTDGCYAILDLQNAQIDAMRKNDKMKLTARTLNGRPLEILMSLKGFGDALDKAKSGK